jgi:serine/threonine protein kinase
MLIEFCGLGATDSMLGKGTLTLTHKVRLLRDAALGLQHLHDEGLVHRDVAARNILVADGWVAKVSDFGMARMYDIASNQGFTQSNVGPLRWMAPESIYERKYSPQSDVWMFGTTILEMLTERPPWLNADKMLDVPGLMRNQELPFIPPETPDAMRNLILHCLQFHAADRPHMGVIATALDQYLDTLPIVNFSTN